MINKKSTHPIGIFDSGIGGLTVAKAVVAKLPGEDIVYFGDTAHLPYGEKSAASIQGYSLKIIDVLLQQHCKLILIACNSASAAAYHVIHQHVGDRAIVLNVIDPVVEYVHQFYQDKDQHHRIGLIGTQQTINSNVYKLKFDALNFNSTVILHATPLLASAIEQSTDNDTIIDELLKQYLSYPPLQDIQALILGCTHYPVIRSRFESYYQNRVKVVDSPEIVAEKVAATLAAQNLVNQRSTSRQHLYVSDYTESFSFNSRKFFAGEVKLEHYPLWDLT